MDDTAVAAELKAVSAKLDDNTKAVNSLKVEMGTLTGRLEERCKDRGRRIGKLENGRWTIFGLIIAVSSAVGGASAMLVRVIWR